MRVPNGASKTLITLSVIVLQTDLQLDSFSKVTLGFLIVAGSQNVTDRLADGGRRDFTTRLAMHLDRWKGNGREWKMETYLIVEYGSDQGGKSL